MSAAAVALRGAGPGGGVKGRRQGAILGLIRGGRIESQADLAAELQALGFAATQATVSRDIAELGLVKALRGEKHVYVTPSELAAGGARPLPDERLRRILADIPVTIGRSGLILVLTGAPGTASIVAQAIDDSSMTEQVGTIAGDNTLIVLFADELRLEHWLARFRELQAGSPGSTQSSTSSLTEAYP